MSQVRFSSCLRALAGIALATSLAACVMAPQRRVEVVHVAPQPSPYEEALRRTHQVEERAAGLHRRLDNNARHGEYPPRYADMLYGRLGSIDREVHDIATGHGGGISGEDQGRLNQELDDLTRMVR